MEAETNFIAALAAAIAGLAPPQPVTAETWSATAVLSEPLSGSYQFRGDSTEMWANNFGDLFFIGSAFFGSGDVNMATCDRAEIVMFDVLFGYSGSLEIQFLFDAEPAGPGQWRAIEPAGFYNSGTREDSFLVNIEVYDGSDLSISSMRCQPDGTVDVSFDYSFTGGSITGKGPDNLTVSGSVEITGIEVQSYDNY